MPDFGFYSGPEFLQKKFENKDYIIDGLMHERDSIVLAGKPKCGKSILLFQMICALTSGEDFLGMFPVRRKCRVLYIQLEGSMDDSQDRMMRMRQRLAFEPENFHIVFTPPVALNREDVIETLIAKIKDRMGTVDVVIIDPLYFAMKGKLTDDDVVRGFTGNIRVLQDALNCTVIITHHFKKARRDQAGNICPADDDDIFGSVFLQAWVTHQFLFDKDKTSNTRILQCNTQRSGKIIDKLNLRLVEPSPLFYECLDQFPDKESCLRGFLEKNAGREFRAREIYSAINMAKSTFYHETKKLWSEQSIQIRTENGERLYSFPTSRRGQIPA